MQNLVFSLLSVYGSFRTCPVSKIREVWGGTGPYSSRCLAGARHDEATEPFQIQVRGSVASGEGSKLGVRRPDPSRIHDLERAGSQLAFHHLLVGGDCPCPASRSPRFPPSQSCCAFGADNGCEAPGFRVILININDSTCGCLLCSRPWASCLSTRGCGGRAPDLPPPLLGVLHHLKGVLISRLPSAPPDLLPGPLP